MRYAKQMQQAGADALELNIYYIPTDPRRHRRTGGAELRRPGPRHEGQVTHPGGREARAVLQFHGQHGRNLDQAGADGLVLFNRFYQPDFDLEALEVVPNLIL